jgi:hypothetical protein
VASAVIQNDNLVFTERLYPRSFGESTILTTTVNNLPTLVTGLRNAINQSSGPEAIRAGIVNG